MRNDKNSKQTVYTSFLLTIKTENTEKYLNKLMEMFFKNVSIYMWHDQGESVGCRKYFFEIAARNKFKFFCFVLFSALLNGS